MDNARSFRNLFLTIVGSCAFLLLAVGSATVPRDRTDYSLVPVKMGALENKDIRIVAADNSFEFKGGQDFTVPFQSSLWGNTTGLTENKLVEQYDIALRLGAKKVLVYIQGREQPLHGVLALSPVIGASYGPGARSYLLSFPADKIKSASNGNISVMYEKVGWRESRIDGRTTDHYWFSWILWLSNSPLR